MDDWVTTIITDYGYFGIFLLILLENVFPPIPSEVVLTVGGFMTATTGLTVFGVVAASTAGSVAGALILYGVGKWMSVRRIEKIIEKHGSWLRLKKEDLHKSVSWFNRYGKWTVFFGRLVPVIRSLISIPAGISGMKFWLFLVFTTSGTLLWNAVLVFIGENVGENREAIMSKLNIYSNIVYLLIGLVAVVAIWYYMKKIRLRDNK